MPGARPLGLLVALPAVLALALVGWGPWRPAGSGAPAGLLGELGRRRRDLSRLAAAVEACAAPAGRALGCAELAGATGVRWLASGITKRVARALLPPAGEEVALKSVHAAGRDVSRCVRRYGHPGGCRRLAAYKLLKEMSLLRCLDHPGVVKLRGQCYDPSVDPEMKITTIMELGTPLEMIQLLQTPWEKRFKICLDLVELLQYLANSPLGSIALLDFQPRQFVLVDGVLKVADLDDVSTEELSCQTDQDCVLEFPTKNFSLKCAVRGKCEGNNERRNLFNAYRYFFMYLLPHAAPLVLQPILKDILNATGDLRFGANETLRAFQKVLHLYKSGLYLQKKPSHLKGQLVGHYMKQGAGQHGLLVGLQSLPLAAAEYIALKGFRSGTEEDYRCWPSYSHLGCVLSVHNAEEAADICSSHSQCQHFIITPQKTWTGRSLALFQSSSADLIPGNNTVVYVKRSTVSRETPLTSSQKGYRDVREETLPGTNFTLSKETTHFISA